MDALIYKCDNGHLFSREKIVPMPVPENFSISNRKHPIVVIDATGAIKRTMEVQDGDQLVACPDCAKIHFFGFDVAE